LYPALEARSFEVWFDRMAMPSRGLTVHQEIQVAVAARRHVADSDHQPSSRPATAAAPGLSGQRASLLDKASTCRGRPYIALVGEEDAVVFRVRRAVFAYDQAYQPFPLPRVSATFWNHAETHSQQHSDVIPDTGADVSVLPDTDCRAIDLFHAPYMTGLAGGVVGASITTLFYRGKVESTVVVMRP
jgi:hypothetical protein